MQKFSIAAWLNLSHLFNFLFWLLLSESGRGGAGVSENRVCSVLRRSSRWSRVSRLRSARRSTTLAQGYSVAGRARAFSHIRLNLNLTLTSAAAALRRQPNKKISLFQLHRALRPRLNSEETTKKTKKATAHGIIFNRSILSRYMVLHFV